MEHPRFHRIFRATHDARDLRVRKTLYKRQFDHGAVVRRESLEGGHKLTAQFPTEDRRCGIVGALGLFVIALLVDGERSTRLFGRTRERFQPCMVGNTEEPGGEASTVGVELARLPPDH